MTSGDGKEAATKRVIEAVANFMLAASQAPEIVSNREFCEASKEVIEALADDQSDDSVKRGACKAVAALFDSLLKETELAEETARDDARRKKETRAKKVLGAISAVVLTTALIKEMPSVALASFGALVGLLAPNVLVAVARLVKKQE